MLHVNCINQTEREKKVGYKLVLSIYECIVLKNKKMTKRKEKGKLESHKLQKQSFHKLGTPNLCGTQVLPL